MHTERGRHGGSSASKGFPVAPITEHEHYFLGSNLTFQCSSKWNSKQFLCLPSNPQWHNGVDEISSMEIKVNVEVDESEQAFVEYEPSFWEWVKLYWNDQI